jgi:hypothetical protein
MNNNKKILNIITIHITSLDHKETNNYYNEQVPTKQQN